MEYGALLYLASLILFNLFVKIRFVPEKLAFKFVAFEISLFLSLLPSQIHDVGNICFVRSSIGIHAILLNWMQRESI